MKDRLKEIRDRLEKATPAPWDIGDGGELSLYEGKNSVVKKGGRVIVSRAVYGRDFDKQTYADVDFIANSPTDIKFLLGTLEHITRLLNTVQVENDVLRIKLDAEQDRERVLETSLDEAKQLIATIKRIREMKDERIAHQGRLIDQLRDRERVLREALEEIQEFADCSDLTMLKISNITEEALKQEVSHD